MNKIIDEIKYDLSFIQSHTLQPKWFKTLKVFVLLGFLGGYYFLFGFAKTIIFSVSFIFLSTVVHFVYRAKTNKYKQSWLDFIVYEEDGELKYKRIGNSIIQPSS
jgi:Ca2+-dependent lipid-binding protein